LGKYQDTRRLALQRWPKLVSECANRASPHPNRRSLKGNPALHPPEASFFHAQARGQTKRSKAGIELSILAREDDQSQEWKGDRVMSDREGFPALPESQGSWRWLLVLGVGLILFGVVALGSAVLMELLALLVLGPLLMASGILQVLLAFFARRPKEAPLHLAAAALNFVIGFLVLVHPRDTVGDLMLVLAAFLLVAGVSRILSSLFFRFRSWGWILGAGIVAVILGLIVWKEGSFRGLWLVAACVGVDFIAHGVSWVALSQRSTGSSLTSPPEGVARSEAARAEQAPLDQPAHQP
jgi:uncharacterized membrane protein HdeD (DUF308 family)